MTLSENEYQEISEAIISELRESEADVYEILKINHKHHEEKVLSTIKWLIDNNVIKQDEEGKLKL